MFNTFMKQVAAHFSVQFVRFLFDTFLFVTFLSVTFHFGKDRN